MPTVRHLGLIPDLCIVDKAQSPLFYEQEEISVDGGENIYRPMTLLQMLALYWRVKKFKFTGYFENSGEYQDGFTEELILQREKNGAPLADEREMVCFNGEWRANGATIMTATLADGFETQFENLNKLIGKIKKDATNMLPTIFIDWTPSNSGLLLGSYEAIGIASQEITNGYTKLDLGYLGEFVWPIYYFEQGDVSFATMEIKAEEWWPYDPGDGLGPIYDKDTGRQERAFPTTPTSFVRS